MEKFNDFDSCISKIANKHFRIRLGKEYDYRLVAYTGLCLLLGCECANHLILKTCKSIQVDKKSFYKPQIGTTVTFYLK